MKERSKSKFRLGEDEARRRIERGSKVAFVVRKSVLVADIDEKTSRRS